MERKIFGVKYPARIWDRIRTASLFCLGISIVFNFCLWEVNGELKESKNQIADICKSNRNDKPIKSYYRETFQIHNWGAKDSVQLRLRYLGNGEISYQLYSASGKLHGLNHIAVKDGDGFPLLEICKKDCGFRSIRDSKAYKATGIRQSSLENWNRIMSRGAYVSYGAYSR